METRLEYLLKLQKHCESKDQRFTTTNVRELNDLLTKAYSASNLLRDEEKGTKK